MPRLSISALAILGVAVAAYFAVTREPKTERIPEPPTATPRTDVAIADEPAAVAATPTAAAAAKIDELNASPETFRNTTFIVAIRGAGFFCDDVADAYQGDTGSGLWRVSCRDMRAYVVGVGDDGALAVEPVLNYFDAPRVPVDIDTPTELRDLLR